MGLLVRSNLQLQSRLLEMVVMNTAVPASTCSALSDDVQSSVQLKMRRRNHVGHITRHSIVVVVTNYSLLL